METATGSPALASTLGVTGFPTTLILRYDGTKWVEQTRIDGGSNQQVQAAVQNARSQTSGLLAQYRAAQAQAAQVAAAQQPAVQAPAGGPSVPAVGATSGIVQPASYSPSASLVPPPVFGMGGQVASHTGGSTGAPANWEWMTPSPSATPAVNINPNAAAPSVSKQMDLIFERKSGANACTGILIGKAVVDMNECRGYQGAKSCCRAAFLTAAHCAGTGGFTHVVVKGEDAGFGRDFKMNYNKNYFDKRWIGFPSPGGGRKQSGYDSLVFGGNVPCAYVAGFPVKLATSKPKLGENLTILRHREVEPGWNPGGGNGAMGKLSENLSDSYLWHVRGYNKNKIYPGDSGAPTVNSLGEVVGVLSEGEDRNAFKDKGTYLALIDSTAAQWARERITSWGVLRDIPIPGMQKQQVATNAGMEGMKSATTTFASRKVRLRRHRRWFQRLRRRLWMGTLCEVCRVRSISTRICAIPQTTRVRENFAHGFQNPPKGVITFAYFADRPNAGELERLGKSIRS